MPTIDPLDYWQFRAVSADLERDHATLLLAQTRYDQAVTRRQAAWTALAAKYGLAPEQAYQASDADCSLTPVTAPMPAPAGGEKP